MSTTTQPSDVLRAALIALLVDELRGAEERAERANQVCLAENKRWSTQADQVPLMERAVAYEDTNALRRTIEILGRTSG